MQKPKGVAQHQFDRYVKWYGHCKSLQEIIRASCLSSHQKVHEKSAARQAQLKSCRNYPVKEHDNASN